MDLGLQGRAGIVTAASKGLGRATALELAELGARVVVVARSPGEVEGRTRGTERTAPVGPGVTSVLGFPVGRRASGARRY